MGDSRLNRIVGHLEAALEEVECERQIREGRTCLEGVALVNLADPFCGPCRLRAVILAAIGRAKGWREGS